MSALVYVVDDELLLAQIMEAILKVEGYDVKMFCDPAAALDSFEHESNKPALLITDYVMQPLNGIELIERFRGGHPPIRSLMVSGNVSQDVLEDVRPDAFLPKPFLPRTLLREVHSLLESASAA